MRVLVIAACLIAGALNQDNAGSITGAVLDPTSAAFASVEITLTGIDVRESYVVKTRIDGHYQFTRVTPGTYRVAVRSGVVPLPATLTVRAGTQHALDIQTAIESRISLGLNAASAAAFRKWTRGGAPPSQPLEWECESNGARCAAPHPALISQPLGEIMMSALTQLDGKAGSVDMSGIITPDGFLTGVTVNSATSEALAAAAITEVSRLRWEPARLRDLPAITSARLDLRF